MYSRVTHSCIVVSVLPQKEDPTKVRLAVGGGKIGYPEKVTIEMVDITTFNICINSLISTRGAQYSGWEIGNYFLETPMRMSEYMRIHIILVPPDIIAHYKLNELVDQDGCIYMK